MRSNFRIAALACAACTAVTVAAGNAHAAVDCATLPSPIYITGSTAVKPFIAALGTVLAGTKTLVYKGQGSCFGPDAIVNATKMTGTASYYDNAGAAQTCNLDVAGQTADVGVSDVYASSCNITTGADVGDFYGPNQVFDFVVPTASSQTAISAETAYLIFGLGADGGVAPYDDNAFIFNRNATSGTQQIIGRSIRVDGGKFKGVDTGGSSTLFTDVSTSTSPEKTIGIISSDFADGNRSKVTTLAYQHYGQSKAYLPNSTSTAFDKANVRDGRYFIWGPLHFFTKVNGSGIPTSTAAADFVGWFQGTTPAPTGVNLLDVEISAYTVPQCAMHVSRASEVSDFACYAPTDPCDCYFDKKATGSTTCTTCNADTDCQGAGQKCRRNFCEAY